MQESRVKSSVKNVGFSLVGKTIALLLKFVLRTVFINTLAAEYLGIDGLFTNLLTLLSLADLGFGLALPYTLYKPLKEKNTEHIKRIMNFYSRVYLIVGSVVMLLGIILTPFIHIIVRGGENVPHLELIYFLYLLNTSFSYLFIYKRTLITADQKDYLVTKVDTICQIFIAALQMVVLLALKDFIAFLLIRIVGTIATNVIIAKICDKEYPFLREKVDRKLERSEIGKTGKDVYALLIYKIASAIETGTDNIIATQFVGIVLVGCLSNYTLILQAITSTLMMMFAAMTASIGNLIVSENGNKVYQIYRVLNFASFWIYGLVSICLLVCIQPFIGNVWLSNEYLLSYPVVSVLILNFYIMGTQNMNSSFRNAYGLFWQARYRPIFMVLVNIVSSVILASKFGLVGVFIGTLLSRILTVGLIDPYIVHKYGLHENVKKYHKDYYSYLVITLITYAFIDNILAWLTPVDMYSLIAKLFVTFILVNAIFIFIFFKNDNFCYLYNVIKGLSK